MQHCTPAPGVKVSRANCCIPSISWHTAAKQYTNQTAGLLSTFICMYISSFYELQMVSCICSSIITYNVKPVYKLYTFCGPWLYWKKVEDCKLGYIDQGLYNTKISHTVQIPYLQWSQRGGGTSSILTRSDKDFSPLNFRSKSLLLCISLSFSVNHKTWFFHLNVLFWTFIQVQRNYTHPTRLSVF